MGANNNDLRVTCKDAGFIKEMSAWYLSQKGSVKPSKSQTCTRAIYLDSARKDKMFGEYDWEGIIIDYMLEKGYELVGNGLAVKFNTFDHGRQELKFIFLSTPKVPVAQPNPPKYTN